MEEDAAVSDPLRSVPTLDPTAHLAGVLPVPSCRKLDVVGSGAGSSHGSRPGGRDGGGQGGYGPGASPARAGQDRSGGRAQGTPVAGRSAASTSQSGDDGGRLPQHHLNPEASPVGSGSIPEVPRMSVPADGSSFTAVDSGSSSVRGRMLLFPLRPRMAVPPKVAPTDDSVELGGGTPAIPPVPVLLPGLARIAPVGGVVAVRGDPPLCLSSTWRLGSGACPSRHRWTPAGEC